LFAGKITEDFVVKELPKETAAKARRTAANLKQKLAKGKEPAKRAPVKKSTKGKQSARKSAGDKKHISMSLLTYKLHALGDYAQTIRQYGTTDSYSSQTVSVLWHSERHLMIFVGRM
jgi:vacuolar-type H+-ATPase subunit E/Vma4